jgi:dienelactone hydrolase
MDKFLYSRSSHMFRAKAIRMIFSCHFLRKVFLSGALATSVLAAAFDASYGSLSPSSRSDSLAEYTDLEFPGNDSRYPLAVMLPGCMGWHPHHDQWRRELLKREFAVLHVNSFAARGLNGPSVLRQEVCSGKILHGDERAGDMVAVLQTVWKNTRIKPEKTLIMGWSHGGWTALDLLVSLESRIQLPNLTQLPALEVNNIKAAILYYPWCGKEGLNWSGQLPTNLQGFVFHGSRDAITSPKDCKRRVQRAAKNGGKLEFVEMKGAFHWFDNHAAQFFDRRSYSIAFSRATNLLKRMKINNISDFERPDKSTNSEGSDNLFDLFDSIDDP